MKNTKSGLMMSLKESMASREFIIEVTITCPQGESLDDWRLVNRLSLDANEDTISIDSTSIGKEIAGELQKWCAEHPEDESSDTRPVS
jgi:hypothetical protein